MKDTKGIANNTKNKPPKDWENHEKYYETALINDWYYKIAIIQDEIMHLTFNYFRSLGIRSVCLPSTTGCVTSPMGLGSDSLPVKINLEGVDTYLADSMQFHLEYMLRFLNQGAHYIMPTFRGEDADERHLCQFYHSEAEIIGELSDVIELVNGYVHWLVVGLKEKCPKEILSITGTLQHLDNLIKLEGNYPIITLDEAFELLNADPKLIETTKFGFRSITDEGEKKLIEHFNGIVWLSHHDYKSVPFYQAKSECGKFAKNADLLFGIGEVVGCGERHESSKDLREAMYELEVSEKEYDWYIFMKNKFPLQTSGFGMGMERFMLFILQHNDIRDIQIIPRFNGLIVNP